MKFLRLLFIAVSALVFAITGADTLVTILEA